MNFDTFFDKALRLGFTRVQITITEYNSSEVKVSNDEVLYNQTNSNVGYRVTALKGNSTYTVTSDYLDDSVLSNLEEKFEVDEEVKEFNFLTDTSKNNNYENIKIIDINSVISKLKLLNNIRDDLVHKVNSIYEACVVVKRIINNNGVDISSVRTNHSCSLELIHESEEKNTVCDKFIVSTNEIDINSMINDLREELSIKIKENSISSNKYNCIIKNRVLNVLLSYIVSGINGTNVDDKTTFLEGKLNKKIFSDKLNIIEEPLNKDYPGYTLFDDEGTFTFNKEIITNGVLKTYLYDNKTAIRNHVEPTGNAYGRVGVRNMHIVPGEMSYKDLIKKLDNGIVIDECMGYHASIHVSNGEISLQALGMIVENGELKSSFIPVIMTTNFEELFSNIEEIGNDLEFDSLSCGSPSILFSNISIAGK